MFHADLHIHSRYSRACSKDCDIEHLAWWAQRKGITVVGTGDFTHPAWAAELRESLIPAEPGLLMLRPELETRLRRTSPPSCAGQVRFMLSSEISTIYRGGDRTRKVHHLIYAPTFEAADHITEALAKIGNLASDGRPILGLDSRNLLEITLAGGPGCYLVPAHAWTPWFAVLGSKSGFDLVADCYGDLADQVFAIETGLSSDPPMNWMCSSLDRYQLVSNSDAHSPPMLGREATTLSCDLDYFAIADAFRTGAGLAGTIEFFPEEGKYHLDGHRKCGIRLDPARSNDHAGICPACEKPLTIGVLHRVAELADRPLGYRPPNAPAFANLVQLRQIVGEIVATGPASKKVTAEVGRLVSVLGPELGILCDVPVSDIERVGGSLLAEAVTRLRRGAVVREAGYDGEYGKVALFAPGEIGGGATLFDLAELELPPAKPPVPEQFVREQLVPEQLVPEQLVPEQLVPEQLVPEPPVPEQLVPEPLGPDGPAPTESARTSPALPVPPPRPSPEASADPGVDADAEVGAGSGVPVRPGVDEEHGAGVQDQAGAAGGTHSGAAAIDEAATRSGPYAALLEQLDADQRAAARADSPLMIVAGPGTGKTRTLTYRIAYQLAASGRPGTSCLAVTFTRRAAEEMRTRLQALARLAPANAVRPSKMRDLSRRQPLIPRDHEQPREGAAAGPAQAPVTPTPSAPAATTSRSRSHDPGGSGPPAAQIHRDDDEAPREGVAPLDLGGVTVTTFHGLGLLILRELHDLAGLPADFQVADEAAMLAVAGELAGSDQAGSDQAGSDQAGSDQAGRDLLTAAAGDQAARETLVKALTARGLVDFDGLIELAVALLSAHPDAAGGLRRRWPMISIDEYQDIDAAQYELLRLLAGDGAGLTAIGDPDQAIYGFRGGDVGFFLRFGQDYPAAATRQLSVSYRSGRPIVAAAAAAVAPATLVPGRRLQAVASGPPVTAHEAADEHAEAAWISATIDELLGGSSFHSLDSGRASGHGHAGLSLADIAVLYRTDAQSAVLGQALDRSGLTFRKGSHDLLQRRTGVPEVIAELRTGPSKATTVAARLSRAVTTVAGRHPGPGAIDIRSAGELLAPLARRCGADLERFLTEVSLGAAVDALDPRADAITLLTMHAAKGLEFEIVFLAGCEYGLLPLHLPWADTDEAEERRLLFVGMTRARSRLLLSYAATRTRHGSAADAGPSPFLRAIGPGLLNRPDPARPRRPAQRQLRLL